MGGRPTLIGDRYPSIRRPRWSRSSRSPLNQRGNGLGPGRGERNTNTEAVIGALTNRIRCGTSRRMPRHHPYFSGHLGMSDRPRGKIVSLVHLVESQEVVYEPVRA